MTDLRRWFDSIDKDRSGTLDAVELQQALRLGNLHFSLFAVAQMIRLFDPQKTGNITFDRFQQLHNFLMNSQQTFDQYDQQRSGEITRQASEQAVRQAGYQLDGPAFNALFQSYDPDQNNMLGKPEYMAMMCFLRGATQTFQSFDFNRVHATLDEIDVNPDWIQHWHHAHFEPQL